MDYIKINWDRLKKIKLMLPTETVTWRFIQPANVVFMYRMSTTKAAISTLTKEECLHAVEELLPAASKFSVTVQNASS